MKRKRHILVVDDEPNVLVTYRLILQQRGYEVSAARVFRGGSPGDCRR